MKKAILREKEVSQELRSAEEDLDFIRQIQTERSQL